MHIVYILHSIKLDRYYTGYTSNLDVRLDFHKNADTHKFTYNADDWTVFMEIQCNSKVQGLNIEKHIKAMKSKTYIENLKQYPEMVEKLVQKYNC